MDTLFLYSLLISTPFQGMLWVILLLLISFFGVYIANLARLGWEQKYTATKPSETQETREQEEKKTPAEKPQEPIYYIVEKKKRRPKQGYGEPKPFQFKEN